MGDGDFGDLARRLFGFDSGAQIGLDLKYAPFRGAQLGIYRTSDRTIQLQGQYNVIKDGNGPIGVGLVVNVDGTDNFTDEFSPGVGDRAVARAWRPRRPLPAAVVCRQQQPDHRRRRRLHRDGRHRRADPRRRATPTCSSKAPPGSPATIRASTLISFGFEQRAGGHVFQLNFSNGFGTTLAQVARGGTASDDWYLGLQSLEEILLMTKAIWKGWRPRSWWRQRRPPAAAAAAAADNQRPPTNADDDHHHADGAEPDHGDDHDWHRRPCDPGERDDCARRPRHDDQQPQSGRTTCRRTRIRNTRNARRSIRLGS